MARESLGSLLSESEKPTWADLTRLLARAFDDRQGREAAQATLSILLNAVAAGRIDRDLVEQLIREMKADARERDRLAQLGGQLKQALKGVERRGGDARDAARSIYQTFYEPGQGEKTLEVK